MHLTTLIVLVHVVMMVLTAVIGIRSPIWATLAFTASEVVDHGKLWKGVTYAFVTFIGIWEVIGLVLFFMFGRQVEDFFQRRGFLRLYITLLLAPPVFLAVLYVVLQKIFGVVVGPFPLIGSATLHFCMFLAFVFLNPRALFFFGIPGVWLASILVGVNTLMYLSSRHWYDLGLLWFGILVTYVSLRRLGMASRFPKLESRLPSLRSSSRRKNKAYRSSRKQLRVVRKKEGRAARRRPARRRPAAKQRKKYEAKLAPRAEVPSGNDAVESIDHLLEKISRHGISSLTENERRQLENARTDLLNDDRGSTK